MAAGQFCPFFKRTWIKVVNAILVIVGIVKVIKTAFIDPVDNDQKFVAVKVKFSERLKKAVSLEDIKKNKALNHLSLIKQSRLSVMSIDFKSWKIIYKMGKV